MSETSAAEISKLRKLRGPVKRQVTSFQIVLNAINVDEELDSLDLGGKLTKHMTYWDEF